MMRFIYVFTKEERDKLLANGYTMLKNDEKRDLYAFVNKSGKGFALLDKLRYALSDTLRF